MSNQFTMSYSGDGALIGPIITKSFEQFPQAKLYDRTSQFRKAIDHEQEVSKYMNEADRKRAHRAHKNLNQPDNSDIQVIVHRMGSNEIVEVVAGNKRVKRSFDFSTATMEKFDAFVLEIMRLIRMMRQQTATPKFS